MTSDRPWSFISPPTQRLERLSKALAAPANSAGGQRAKGKSKSGGARVVYFYSGKNVPLFLLDIYGKGEKDSLTKAERNVLKTILSDLVDAYLET